MKIVDVRDILFIVSVENFVLNLTWVQKKTLTTKNHNRENIDDRNILFTLQFLSKFSMV
jgi:hypothetical protein